VEQAQLAQASADIDSNPHGSLSPSSFPPSLPHCRTCPLHLHFVTDSRTKVIHWSIAQRSSFHCCNILEASFTRSEAGVQVLYHRYPGAMFLVRLCCRRCFRHGSCREYVLASMPPTTRVQCRMLTGLRYPPPPPKHILTTITLTQTCHKPAAHEIRKLFCN